MKNGLDSNLILTPLQRKVCQTLFRDDEFASLFYLTGGTALSAFYLEHRESDDLDFFTHQELPERFVTGVERLLHEFGPRIVRRSPYFLRVQVEDSLLLDFAHDTAVRFGLPVALQGIRVDTEENIAVNKVTTILGRLDPKDYVDLLFLIRDRGHDVHDLIEKGKQKDGGLEAFYWSQLIAECDNFTILPRMRKPLTLEELKKFFRGLRRQIVRRLKPA